MKTTEFIQNQPLRYQRYPQGTLHSSTDEIQHRLKLRYMDRLADRVKKLRRLLIEKQWKELKLECHQIALSADTFGFGDLAHQAHVAQEALPSGKISRPATPIHAKKKIEELITTIDTILMNMDRRSF